MAIREYTTTNETRCSGGAIGAIAEDAHTLVVLVKPNTVTGDKGIIDCRIAGSSILALMYVQSTGIWMGGDSGDHTGVSVAPLTTTWQVFGWNIANGTSTPRFHRKQLGAGSWSHSNASGTMAENAGTVNQVVFGSTDFAFTSNHRYAVAAVYNYQLSDGEWEAIDTNASTAYLDSLNPVAGWEFNQANIGDAITDWTGGGANQASQSGTTVINDDDPAWTFGLEAPPEKQSFYASRRRSWR